MTEPEADPDPPDSPDSDSFHRFVLSPSPVDAILPVLLTPEERGVLSLQTFAFEAPGLSRHLVLASVQTCEKKIKTAINSNYSQRGDLLRRLHPAAEWKIKTSVQPRMLQRSSQMDNISRG